MNCRVLPVCLLITAAGLFSGCHETTRSREAVSSPLGADPLPSWNEGQTKERILSFVARVTDPSHGDYVPPEDRVAVFDNDGTLWAEKPLYFPVAFVFDRIVEMAPEHPEWASQPPFQDVLEKGKAAFQGMSLQESLKLSTVAETGMTQEEFRELVGEWLENARHPESGKPYTDYVYQPQLELLDHLRANGFRIFIVTGSFSDYARAVAEREYGIPRENVIGSLWTLSFRDTPGETAVVREPEILQFNDRAEKVLSIERHIGRRPLLAVGNSNGDAKMLSYTTDRPGPALAVLIDHDDPDREFLYRAEDSLRMAEERDWVVVSMKNDFREIFSRN